jgi:hypothetical protein
MDLPDWRPVQEDRYEEPLVQQRAMDLLRDTPEFAVSLLKDSIVYNGLVNTERIVVRPYETNGDLYVAVEGNRRLAAIRWILEEEQSGILTLSDDARHSLSNLEVLLLDPSDPENELAIETLMAIRHVGGIKEWGAYQQARLIVRLKELPEATYTSVAQRLGMSSREVARRYRGAMALKQMENDEEFRSYATPEMHGLFQETFATTAVRDWLVWDEDRHIYTNRQNLESFYTWVSSTDEHSAKIASVFDVRKLRSIVENAEALTLLRDQGGSITEAAALAEQAGAGSRVRSSLETAISQAAAALENLPAGTLRALTPEQLAMLEDLRSQIDQTLELHRRLQG